MLQAQLEESKEEIDKLNKKFSEIKNTSLESNTVSNVILCYNFTKFLTLFLSLSK